MKTFLNLSLLVVISAVTVAALGLVLRVFYNLFLLGWNL